MTSCEIGWGRIRRSGCDQLRLGGTGLGGVGGISGEIGWDRVGTSGEIWGNRIL